MRRPGMVLVCLMVVELSSFLTRNVIAQMSAEDAQERLAAREAQDKMEAQQDAAAATQPSALTNGEVAALKKTIEKQQSQITELQTQIAQLTAKLNSALSELKEAKGDASAGSAGTDADAIKAAQAQHTLAVGMTLDQCNQSIGKPGRVTGADAGGTQYEWDQLIGVGQGALGNPEGSIHYTGTIQDGKLVDFHKSDPIPFDPGTAITVDPGTFRAK